MRFWIGLVLCGGLLMGCSSSSNERIRFDGQLYNAKVRKVERQLDTFTVSVRPVSKSLQGAREAGQYEATVYCVNTFGSSDIIWTAGPDAPDEALTIDKDTLVLQGKCPNAN